MRHGLLAYYGVSILFLLTIFLLSVASIGHFYSQTSQLTTVYSQNVIKSLGVRVFGSFTNAMATVSLFGILAQLYIFYMLLNFNKFRKVKNLIKIALFVLFAPYVSILILSLRV